MSGIRPARSRQFPRNTDTTEHGAASLRIDAGRPRSAPGTGVHDRRHQLRILDQCLRLLEDTQERGETLVGAELAARLRPHVPRVAQGMQLTFALNLALREQERYLSTTGQGSHPRADDCLDGPQRGDHIASRRGRPRVDQPAPGQSSVAGRRGGARDRVSVETQLLGVSRPDDHGMRAESRRMCVPGEVHPAPLDAAQARTLTERIKAAVVHISRMLLEAHDGRAWLALGYETWAAYVEAEFRFSKQRSFQLIDHARFIRALEAATGGSTMVDLPERISRGLKPHLSSIIAAIRSRTMSASEGDLHALVEDVVREERLRLLSPDPRPHRSPVPAVTRQGRARTDLTLVDGGSQGTRARKGGEAAHLQLLLDALAVLANMPPCADVLAVITDARALANLEPAVSWLASFASQWEALISHKLPNLPT